MPASPRWFAQELEQLPPRVGLRLHGVADVRPIEALDEHAWAVELEPRDDLVARAQRRRGRQRHARHAGQPLLQRIEAEILRRESRGPIATRNAPRRSRRAKSAVAQQRLRLALAAAARAPDTRAPACRGAARAMTSSCSRAASASSSGKPPRRRPRAARRPGPPSARSAATRRRRRRRAPAPGSDSTATCRRRSASARASRGRPAPPSMMAPCWPRKLA